MPDPRKITEFGAVTELGGDLIVPTVDTSQVANIDKNKRFTLTVLRTWLKTYFDTLYAAAGSYLTSITTSTPTNLTGLLKGNGTEVDLAVAGTDYSTFNPAIPGPIGETTPAAGYFTTLESADSVSISDMTDVWNDSGTTFTALKMNVTDTASAAASKLLDLHVGGTSKFSVEKDGDINVKGKLFFRDTDLYLYYRPDGAIASNYGFTIDLSTLTFADVGSGGVSFGAYGAGSETQPIPLYFKAAGNAILQFGLTADTVATPHILRGHPVTTGAGGGLTIQGGPGSTAKGDVILDGGNRAAYDASPSSTTIRDILIAHGLMAAS